MTVGVANRVTLHDTVASYRIDQKPLNTSDDLGFFFLAPFVDRDFKAGW